MDNEQVYLELAAAVVEGDEERAGGSSGRSACRLAACA